MSGAGTFVIVGAGLAGAQAAETLRAEGHDGRIVLVGAEPDRPYERPPLSKALLLGFAAGDVATAPWSAATWASRSSSSSGWPAAGWSPA